MAIALAVLSMLAVGVLAAVVNKVLNLRICPVCAGVAGTWILMLILRFLEYPISVPLLTMFLGGSVVGIAYTLEKRLSVPNTKMLFKSFFIPVGFIAAYGIVIEDWIMAGGAIIALAIISGVFLSRREQAQSNGTREELKKKLDECC